MLQQTIIVWLVLLPLVLAAFRSITIGDRLNSDTVTGFRGGESTAQNNLLLAGLGFIALVLLAVFALQANSPLSLAIAILAFGGFVVAGYLAGGFRRRVWQRFLGAALQEAAVYWLVLAIGRFVIDLDAARSAASQAAPGQNATGSSFELQAAVWIVIVAASLALILGTGARMVRRP